MTPHAIAVERTNHRAAVLEFAPGIAIWTIYLSVARPNLMGIEWGRAVLLFAALVIVPLAMRSLNDRRVTSSLLAWVERLRLPAALLLGVSLLQSAGPLAALFSLPWLAVTLLIAWQGTLNFAQSRRDAAITAGMVYLAIGGVWTLCDRLPYAPLGFDREIGLLTAIHFHYAGFALPILAGLAARELRTNAAKRIAWSTIIAIPGLAVGITAAHLGAPAFIETLSAAAMAVSAIGVAWLYLQLAIQPNTSFEAKFLWTIGAIVLAAAMLPAILYGARAWFQIAWLDIPLMRAVHGSANAFGFTLPALLGWRWMRYRIAP
jgi:hypothetical protein